jgi:hypothetical protein
MINRSFQITLLLFAALGAASSLELVNGGFEQPLTKGWTTFSHESDAPKITVTTTKARNGKQSVQLVATTIADSYQGLFQPLSVKPDASYRFTAYVMNDADKRLSGTARGQISIEWKDAGGKEIDRAWGPDWGADLPSERWMRQEMTAKAPPSATTAHFVITLHEGKGPSSGAFYADDASAGEAP